MFPWIVIGLAFLGAFFAVIAANATLLEFASGEQRRLNEEVQEGLRLRPAETESRHWTSAMPKTAAWAPYRDLTTNLGILIDQSGLTVTPRQLALRAILLAVVAGAAGWFYFETAVLALPIAVAASMLPLMHLFYARGQRLERLREQLPDTFELMSRVLRAGQTVSQAMQVVADQGSPPVSLEFYRCHEQMNLGMSPETAFHELANRTGILELRIFTVAILVQRQAGGNLSELFDKMGTVVRERFRIRGMIKSLTAQGRMQAWLLSGLPVAMFVLLMMTQPDYERQLFNYPMMLLAAVGMIVVGGVWIRRVVDFDF